jgi:hypothetical protein
MEARKAVKQSSWSSVAKLMGGFSRKGLNYFGQSKSRRQEKTPTSYGKNWQKSFPSPLDNFGV